ncbi:hypothetical protein [Streptomyces omiyaensis]|uniref:hypothetical protein n=1 Tax=Streptomyces omiyaensis TaxID=68247 RepID=UPI0036FF7602
MHFNISPPLALAALLTFTVTAALAAGRLDNHRTYGLYAVAIALTALHSALYGRPEWACFCAAAATGLAVAWWRGGGTHTVRRALGREPRR